MSQKTYLCVQRSDSGRCDPPSPSEMEEMYAKFVAWKDKFADNIVDMGGKLSQEGIVAKHGGEATDGPYMESKEIIGGYMIITAKDLEEALEVVNASPGVVSEGSSVEIREIQTG